MSVTVHRFRLAFPEFKRTPEATIKEKIRSAALRVNASIWGDKADDGIMWLTAHLLSVAPMGEQARLKLENRGTMYGVEYKKMVREVTFAHGRLI